MACVDVLGSFPLANSAGSRVHSQLISNVKPVEPQLDVLQCSLVALVARHAVLVHFLDEFLLEARGY